MSIAGSHDAAYQFTGDALNLSVVASTAGTVVSTAAIPANVYLILTTAVGIPSSSTGGVRIKIGAPTDSVVSSTLGCLLTFNFPEVFKVRPGQIVMALSNNTGSCSLNIMPLTN